ncbi:hypothetical protein A33M_2824 [Rhodovulum sp. PH10]|nr:hypothetical protein A33M_2824 [Rhodovulum sp. PH10]
MFRDPPKRDCNFRSPSPRGTWSPRRRALARIGRSGKRVRRALSNSSASETAGRKPRVENRWWEPGRESRRVRLRRGRGAASCRLVSPSGASRGRKGGVRGVRRRGAQAAGAKAAGAKDRASGRVGQVAAPALLVIDERLHVRLRWRQMLAVDGRRDSRDADTAVMQIFGVLGRRRGAECRVRLAHLNAPECRPSFGPVAPSCPATSAKLGWKRPDHGAFRCRAAHDHDVDY